MGALTGQVFAINEASVVAILVAAIPACIAAWASLRTRKENTQQHGASQTLLGELAGKIDRHGDRLEHVAQRIDHVAERVDHAHDRIDDHADKFDRHVDELNERHGYRPGL